jgi:hypothetical protein
VPLFDMRRRSAFLVIEASRYRFRRLPRSAERFTRSRSQVIIMRSLDHVFIAAAIGVLICTLVLGFQDRINAMALGAVLTCAFLLAAAHNGQSSRGGNPGSDQGDSILYSWFKPNIRDLKVLLQMIGGFGLICILVSKLSCRSVGVGCFQNDYLSSLYTLDTLRIVSLALAYSSGIELAYMLFTPGPDEAVTPLIMGLAAGILYAVSSIDHADQSGDLKIALSVGVLTLALALLFFIKNRSFDNDKKDRESVLECIGKWIDRNRKPKTNNTVNTEEQHGYEQGL